jgi:hypothetical protein
VILSSGQRSDIDAGQRIGVVSRIDSATCPAPLPGAETRSARRPAQTPVTCTDRSTLGLGTASGAGRRDEVAAVREEQAQQRQLLVELSAALGRQGEILAEVLKRLS